MSECLTYTLGEAAKAIGVGRSLAYELARRGDLRTVHVGRRVLVPRDAVRDFLGLRQEQAPASPRATPENGSDEVTYPRTNPLVALPNRLTRGFKSAS